MIDGDVADILHVQAVGFLGMFEPTTSVELDDPIVVGADPKGVALHHQAVDKLVFQLLVEVGIVGPLSVLELVESLSAAHPQVASVVGSDGQYIVADKAGILLGIVRPLLRRSSEGGQCEEQYD